MLTCFSRPEVRFRPLPTCGRRIPAYAAYDLSSGSGLASNRKNLSTPRDSILPLKASCFLNRRFAIDRCGPSVSLCAAGAAAVNSLQPRTLHQLENLENCQRTSLFYTLQNFRQQFFAPLFAVCFQPSAARPQTHDRKWCKPSYSGPAISTITRLFALFLADQFHNLAIHGALSTCDNRVNPAFHAVLRERTNSHSGNLLPSASCR